ncbi:MAG: hypothetical protein KAQ64_00420 [Candidatus Pacebacteria bacterium]|nr:hypothetical protein [Candidatus Paceibacterota bacterium]
MRIVEDIICVKKDNKKDLLRNYNAAKKVAASSRSKNKTDVRSVENKAKKVTNLESLISSNKRLIFGIIFISFISIVFMGLFLYNSDKEVPVSVENIATELEKENELLEKEISEIEESDSNDALENIIRRIKGMSD